LKLLKKHTRNVYLVLSVTDCTQPESRALSLLRHPTQESKRTLIERTSSLQAYSRNWTHPGNHEAFSAHHANS